MVSEEDFKFYESKAEFKKTTKSGLVVLVFPKGFEPDFNDLMVFRRRESDYTRVGPLDITGFTGRDLMYQFKNNELQEVLTALNASNEKKTSGNKRKLSLDPAKRKELSDMLKGAPLDYSFQAGDLTVSIQTHVSSMPSVERNVFTGQPRRVYQDFSVEDPSGRQSTGNSTSEKLSKFSTEQIELIKASIPKTVPPDVRKEFVAGLDNVLFERRMAKYKQPL